MNTPILFSAGDYRIAPAQLLSAAALWGSIGTLTDATRSRTACQEHARKEAIEVPAEVLQGASEQFRRAHGLRTVEATQTWMDAWGVSIEVFTDYLERETLRNQFNDAVVVDPYNPETPDRRVMKTLWPDAVFSGAAGVWSQRLAARVAVACETAGTGAIPGSLFDPAAAPGLFPDTLRTWIDLLELPLLWFDQLVELEAGYARFAEATLTPSRLDAVLRARWTTLFSVDFEMGGFQTEAAAREATLCVTEDGLAIQEICAEAGGNFHRGRVMLGDVPDDVQPKALSATEGTLLPVFAWHDEYFVCRVRGKSEPSLDDPLTRETVARAVLEDAVRPLTQRHIQWAPGITP